MKPSVDLNEKRTFAERLKKIRLESKLSQKAFADSISVSRVHYNRMEAPEIASMPSRPVIRRICELYDVDYGWLSTGAGEPHPQETSSKKENENTLISTSLILEQTTDYISLKTKDLLTTSKMEPENFNNFFKMFSSSVNFIFQLMSEIKKTYETETELSAQDKEKYIEEFKQLLYSTEYKDK